jgi:hypothetical protein
MTTNVVLSQAVVPPFGSAPNADGMILELGREILIIRAEASSGPMSFDNRKTSYVDEGGAIISVNTVKSGSPVTVYYKKSGQKLMATKVMVRKSAASPNTPAVKP